MKHRSSLTNSRKTKHEHRMVFLLLILIILGNFEANHLRAQEHGMECWMDSRGAWTWGFAGQFAVYDNQAWQYESGQKNGDNRTLVLRNGNERLRADFQLTSDTTCTITVDGSKPQTYRRWNSRKGIFAYLPTDNMPPTPCTFQEDSMVLRGYWPQAAGQPLTCLYVKAFTPEQASATTGIDSTGYFELRLSLTGLTRVILQAGQTGYESLCLSPKGNAFAYLQDSTTLVMGTDSRLCHERMATQGFESFTNDRLTDNACVREVRKLLAQSQAALTRTLQQHPNLSAAYRHQAEEEISYSILWTLFNQQFHRIDSTPAFSPELLSLADSLMREMPAFPTMTSMTHWVFMENSLSYFLEQDYPGYLRQIKRALSEDKSLQVPDSTMRHLGQTLDAGTALLHKTAGKEAVATFHQQQSATLRELSRYAEPDLFTTAFLRSQLEAIAPLPLPDGQKDYMKAMAMIGHIERNLLPLPDKVYREALRQIGSPDLRETVSRHQLAYQRVQQTDFDYQGSLKSNDIVAGLTDGQEILRRILAPLRGKVVYTDIWGSWCTPCKRDMRLFAPAVKEALKGRDVVFLYLANNTSDASWKQIIKEYGCVGPQTVHYNLPAEQQEAVERLLLHQGTYPSYGLFDKNGKLVTKNAPRPGEKDQLIQVIEEQLRTPTASDTQP